MGSLASVWPRTSPVSPVLGGPSVLTGLPGTSGLKPVVAWGLQFTHKATHADTVNMCIHAHTTHTDARIHTYSRKRMHANLSWSLPRVLTTPLTPQKEVGGGQWAAREGAVFKQDHKPRARAQWRLAGWPGPQICASWVWKWGIAWQVTGEHTGQPLGPFSRCLAPQNTG